MIFFFDCSATITIKWEFVNRENCMYDVVTENGKPTSDNPPNIDSTKYLSCLVMSSYDHQPQNLIIYSFWKAFWMTDAGHHEDNMGSWRKRGWLCSKVFPRISCGEIKGIWNLQLYCRIIYFWLLTYLYSPYSSENVTTQYKMKNYSLRWYFIHLKMTQIHFFMMSNKYNKHFKLVCICDRSIIHQVYTQAFSNTLYFIGRNVNNPLMLFFGNRAFIVDSMITLLVSLSCLVNCWVRCHFTSFQNW